MRLVNTSGSKQTSSLPYCPLPSVWTTWLYPRLRSDRTSSFMLKLVVVFSLSFQKKSRVHNLTVKTEVGFFFSACISESSSGRTNKTHFTHPVLCCLTWVYVAALFSWATVSLAFWEYIPKPVQYQWMGIAAFTLQHSHVWLHLVASVCRC